MPKSKSRTNCEDCSLCERIADFDINNDIRALLAKVQQFDIDILNQFKCKEYNFECFVCSFKTSVFNDWKRHILSMSHMTDSHRIKNVYSYICTNNGCNALLYGTKKSVLSHLTYKHSKPGDVNIISILMAEVMRRYMKKLSPLYFCSHCKRFKENPIHVDKKSLNNENHFINYYCKFCRVTFFASPEMIDYHSLSVEHMTLKCFNVLCSTAQISSKRIKVSEQSNQNKESNRLPAVKNVSTINPIQQLPMQGSEQSNENNDMPTVKNVSTSNSIKVCDQSNQKKENNSVPVVKNVSTSNSIQISEQTIQNKESNCLVTEQTNQNNVLPSVKNVSTTNSMQVTEQTNQNKENDCLMAVKNVSTTNSIHVVEQTNQNKENNVLPSVKNVSTTNSIHISEQTNQNKENNWLSAVNNVSTTNNSIKFPIIVLNRFKQINVDHGECKLCNVSVDWKNIYNHLLNCEHKSGLTDLYHSTIKTFNCNVCNYFTNYISGHKMHIISYEHLTNCHNTTNYYSCFCKVCNIFMYSNKFDIQNHWTLNHKDTVFIELPLFSFMANVLIDFNKNPDRIETIHYYGNSQHAEHFKSPSFHCYICKIEFHTCIDDFKMHLITSEHIILQFLSSNENNLMYNEITTKPIEIQDFPLFQKDDKDAGKEYFQNIQINKSQINVNCTTQIENVQKMQESFENIIKQEEKNDHAQNSIKCSSKSNTELTQNHSKLQYTKYFKRKINILTLLNQFKDRAINSLSYYCDICDFMDEEKDVWDSHIQEKHFYNTNKSTIFCSTCSMFIFGESNKDDHNNTIEHCIILQLLQSLKLVEEDLINKIVLAKSVGTSEWKEIFIDKEINKQQISKIIEDKEYQYNNSKNNNTLKFTKQNSNEEDPSTTNAFLSLNENKGKHLNESDKSVSSTTSKGLKSIFCEVVTTLNNSHGSTLHTIPYELDVYKNIKNNMNCVDLSTSESLSPEEENLMNTSESVKSVESRLSDKLSIVLEINKQLELDNIDANNVCQNSDDDSCEESLINEKQNEHKSNEPVSTTSNSQKSAYDVITSKLSNFFYSFGSSTTIQNKLNIEENTKENMNCEDMSFNTSFHDLDTQSSVSNSVKSDETENEEQEVFSNCSNTTSSVCASTVNIMAKVDELTTDQLNEDRVYGEYVIQRLNNLENETVKQNIKLEIDYLFYNKMN